MICDIHSHVREVPGHFTEDFRRQAARARAGVEVDLAVRYEAYRAAAPDDTVTIVLGGKARRSGVWADDDYVARYVAQDAVRLIGFLSVDSTQPRWQEELREGHERLKLCGIKLLFGTDFPFTTVNASMDGIRGLNRMLEGTSCPRLDERQLDAMVHRDSLALLGLR